MSRNRVYHLYKSVPFTEKRPRRSETGIKDGFHEIEREFLFETFRPEKQDYLFRCSDAPGNFQLERPKKSRSIYFPNRFSGNFSYVKNPRFQDLREILGNEVCDVVARVTFADVVLTVVKATEPKNNDNLELITYSVFEPVSIITVAIGVMHTSFAIYVILTPPPKVMTSIRTSEFPLATALDNKTHHRQLGVMIFKHLLCVSITVPRIPFHHHIMIKCSNVFFENLSVFRSPQKY